MSSRSIFWAQVLSGSDSLHVAGLQLGLSQAGTAHCAMNTWTQEPVTLAVERWVSTESSTDWFRKGKLFKLLETSAEVWSVIKQGQTWIKPNSKYKISTWITADLYLKSVKLCRSLSIWNCGEGLERHWNRWMQTGLDFYCVVLV